MIAEGLSRWKQSRKEQTAQREQHKLEHKQLVQIRTQIGNLTRNGQWDELLQIPGIKLVEKAEKRPSDEVCWHYALGYDYVNNFEEGSDPKSIVEHYVSWNCYESPEPEPGDIVIYYDGKKRTGNIGHVAVVTGENECTSKFGLTHVFTHPPLYVPLSYGTPFYYRHNPGIQLRDDIR